ncbi:hypothetical protein L1987_52341 [Smallanthus sonchifolius]|uniref:Uncharacterized protein n=1 Tax=Smallanthus sonchifolius TaxID=185202 RepID=A0ACB9ES74_9ASTR|nr:hypothetical protein L1987_52341 [Smallanthus sonchifolius]
MLLKLLLHVFLNRMRIMKEILVYYNFLYGCTKHTSLVVERGDQYPIYMWDAIDMRYLNDKDLFALERMKILYQSQDQRDVDFCYKCIREYVEGRRQYAESRRRRRRYGILKRSSSSSPQDVEVRKGPWTMEEDLILINYIADHGEGVWNTLAKSAGLKRTGKSCRLRWLNYLRPDVRRGNITPEEQLLIMELHSKWGNRWSKIAKHLPGRTDNEIKNYWRTRIQKHVKQTDSFNGQTSSGLNSQVNTIPVQTCNVVNPMELYYPPCENAMDIPSSFSTGTNESTWCMEDLWSLQLLNHD